MYGQLKELFSSALCQAAASIENIHIHDRLPATNRRPGLKQRRRAQRQRVYHPDADAVDLFDDEHDE